MPAQYEKIRDSYLARGKSKPEAEKLAAMTYNSHRKPGQPSLNAYVAAEKKGRPLHQFRSR